MRLFVAIGLDDRVRKTLRRLQDELRPRCADVRWTPPEQLHITVKFLGEVEDRRVTEIASAVGAAAGRCTPFELRVLNAGCFPARGEVRIVWAGVEDAEKGAAKCAELVESGLEAIGFARESRAFSPHITIGRVRADHSNGKLRGLMESARSGPDVQQVGNLRLMSSVLSAHGSEYATVASLQLGVQAPDLAR